MTDSPNPAPAPNAAPAPEPADLPSGDAFIDAYIDPALVSFETKGKTPPPGASHERR